MSNVKMQPFETAKEAIWTRDFSLLVVVMVTLSLTYQILATTMALFVHNLGGSASITGMIMLGWTILSTCTRPVVGAMSDRQGPKKLVFIGGSVFVLSIAACSFIQSLDAFIILRLVQAVAHAVVFTAASAAISEVLPKSRVGEATSYFVGFPQDISIALGASVGLALIFDTDFSWLFLGTAGIVVMGLIITALTRHKGNVFEIKTQARMEGKAPLSCEYKGIWKYIEKTAIWPTIIMVLSSFGGLCVIFFLPLYAKTMSIPNVGLFFTATAFAQFATRFFSGRLVDRIGLLPVLVPGVLLNVIAYSLLAMHNTNFLLIGIIYGLGQGVIRVLLNAAVLKAVPKDRIGTATGTFALGNGIGLGICAFVWGIVVDKAGFYWMFGGSAAIMGIVALLAIVTLREKPIKGFCIPLAHARQFVPRL